jgi:DNA-binding response OmpR family regulator
MKKGIQGLAGLASQVTVLFVGPEEADHSSLKAIFDSAEWDLCPDSMWRLETKSSVESAIGLLRRSRIPVVVCAHDLKPGSWRDLLRQLDGLPEPPALVVTSRLADDHLWAEALNLGAYDVLAEPFDRAEVVRVLSLAWLSRYRRPQVAAPRGPLAVWAARASAAGGSNGLRQAV